MSIQQSTIPARSCQLLKHFVPRDPAAFNVVRLDPIWSIIPDHVARMFIVPQLTHVPEYTVYKDFVKAVGLIGLAVRGSRYLSKRGSFWGFCMLIGYAGLEEQRHVTISERSMVEIVTVIRRNGPPMFVGPLQAVVFNATDPHAWVSRNLPYSVSPPVSGYWEYISDQSSEWWKGVAASPLRRSPPPFDSLDEWLVYLPALLMRWQADAFLLQYLDVEAIRLAIIGLVDGLFHKAVLLDLHGVLLRQLLLLRAQEVSHLFSNAGPSISAAVFRQYQAWEPLHCRWFPFGWDIVQATCNGFAGPLYVEVGKSLMVGGLIGGNVDFTYHFLRSLREDEFRHPAYFRSVAGDTLLQMVEESVFPHLPWLARYILEAFSLRQSHFGGKGGWVGGMEPGFKRRFIHYPTVMKQISYGVLVPCAWRGITTKEVVGTAHNHYMMEVVRQDLSPRYRHMYGFTDYVNPSDQRLWSPALKCRECDAYLSQERGWMSAVEMCQSRVQLQSHLGHTIQSRAVSRMVEAADLSIRSLLECTVWLYAYKSTTHLRTPIYGPANGYEISSVQYYSVSMVASANGAGPGYSWLRM